MARPHFPPWTPKSSHVKAGSTAAVGDLLVYTCPAGVSAEIVSCMTDSVAAAVQVQGKFRSGADEILMVIAAAGAEIPISAVTGSIALDAGEVFALEIDAAFAATAADAYIGIREFQTV